MEMRGVVALVPASLCLLFCGCGASYLSSSSGVSSSTQLQISGKVHGGQQPISGATVQLYATNTATDAGASTAMLTSAVTTGTDGSFSITGDYTCPAGNPLVYLLATGGNPGMSGNVNNSDIVLLSALGTCSSLTSSTYVVMNELTTMLSVQALAPFMTDGTHVGESPTNPVAIAGAMNEVTSLGSLGTGNFGGSGLDYLPLELQFNMEADILAACVNTAGGTSGDGTACGKLLQYTGGHDTVTAALEMAQTPTTQASSLFGLIVPQAPFQPLYSALPSDLAVTVGYTLPYDIFAAPHIAGALDSNGHIWLYFGGYTYNTVADTSTDVQGSIVVYDNNFNQLFTVAAGTGGLYYPDAFSADANGNVYAMNANNTITELSSTGTAVSPPAGWATGITANFSPTGPGNSYQDNTTQAGAVRVEKVSGNMWGTAPSGSAHCYYEVNSSGTVITPSNTTAYCTQTADLTSIEPDGSGNAWGFGLNSIAQVTSSGAIGATAASTQGCLYTSFAAGNNQTVATQSLRYDHAHNQVWGVSYLGAGAITDGGSNVFCNSGATTMPVIVPYSNGTTVGGPYSAGSLSIEDGVLDGAGNLWFITTGATASGTLTGTGGAFNGTANFSTYLGEVTSSGSLATPYNLGSQTFGLQPSGVGVNAAANVTGQGIYTAGLAGGAVGLLGIDASGNIWVFDEESLRVIKISGLATANTVNY